MRTLLRYRATWTLGIALLLMSPALARAQADDPHAGHEGGAANAAETTKPAAPETATPPAADPHAGHDRSDETRGGTNAGAGNGARAGSLTLPPMPANMPGWMSNRQKNHIFYKSGPYNFDIYNIKPLAYDLNAVAVGHAMAYEDLVTGKADTLETKTFERINRVLNNPPRLMPDEAAISPTFGRKYGVLEMMFDWTHVLHAQTVDVLASTDMTQAEKDREIEALWKYYFESVPWKITPLPMNMGYLDSQPYSKAFRQEYPKVNGLFWGYHWLQNSMYDLLYGKTLAEQRAAYETMGRQYHTTELYRTDRPFMPMFAEHSPVFAKKYPHIANAFDNLHMLHDMVNDILASDWMTEEQKENQILRAMWIVSDAAHQGEKPGDFNPNDPMHDHRFMPGMPGMGMMPAGMEGHNMEGMDGMDGAQGSGTQSPPANGAHQGHPTAPAKPMNMNSGANRRPAPSARPAASRTQPKAAPKAAPKAKPKAAPKPPAPANDPHAGHM